MIPFFTRPERLLDVLVLGLSVPTILIAISLQGGAGTMAREGEATPASCLVTQGRRPHACVPAADPVFLSANLTRSKAPSLADIARTPISSRPTGTWSCVPPTGTRPVECWVRPDTD